MGPLEQEEEGLQTIKASGKVTEAGAEISKKKPAPQPWFSGIILFLQKWNTRGYKKLRPLYPSVLGMVAEGVTSRDRIVCVWRETKGTIGGWTLRCETTYPWISWGRG